MLSIPYWDVLLNPAFTEHCWDVHAVSRSRHGGNVPDVRRSSEKYLNRKARFAFFPGRLHHVGQKDQ